MSEPKIAIVHERFTELGGSERVVEQMCTLWPDAKLHAPIADERALPASLAAVPVRTSALQSLYRRGRAYGHLLPLLPAAMASLDLRDADVVVTSHHAFANRVRPHPGTPVISYTHTPARWMWDPSFLGQEVGGPVGRTALRAFARTQRPLDAAAARRTRLVLVNSTHVAARVRRSWSLPSRVLPPPVNILRFHPDPTVRREDFFLLAGRLVPYKRPDLAVAAARRAGVKLVVAGEGRMRSVVEAQAGPTVEFLGPVDDDTLLDLYRRCRALVFPGEEDFGLVPVEAQACGTPVLAHRVGGVLDTVIDGTTGSLYSDTGEGELQALVSALRRFDDQRFDPPTIRKHAERFSPEVFRRRLAEAVEGVLGVAAGV